MLLEKHGGMLACKDSLASFALVALTANFQKTYVVNCENLMSANYDTRSEIQLRKCLYVPDR